MLEKCGEVIAREFAYLRDEKNQKLYYLDSGASSLRPLSVIEEMAAFEKFSYANVHRGVYRRSEESTFRYERVRQQVADFVRASTAEEIVFTSGATASLNIVAHCYASSNLKSGDEICLPITEHHSNIVPWQMVCEKVGCRLVYIPLDASGRLDMEQAAQLIGPRTKIVAFGHVSNVTGVVNPVSALIRLAKSVGAKTVIDGSQAGGHVSIDVLQLDCDFYALTGHKMLAPSGVGVLYGKKALLDSMPPLFGGGEMISRVQLHESQYKSAPHRYEAGTPLISAVIGLGKAIDLWNLLDREALRCQERHLGEKAATYLESVQDVQLLSPRDRRHDWIGTVAFSHPRIHPHDLAAVMDSYGVCVRAGQHCTEPLHRALGVHSSIRLSPFVYNSEVDIDKFELGMEKCLELFDS
ncbi:MAG: SufS family cysteine desulfurase [Zetaproteobacteria bacterium]|nr:SufS family cysteine desulfurase [Zetaproteobacteria bacterium]